LLAGEAQPRTTDDDRSYMEAETQHLEIGRLILAMEALGDALASANLERLLEAEAVLADAVGTLPPSVGLESARVRELEAELVRARAALQRWRRLGASLAHVARISLGAQGATSCCDRREQRRRG
jgi:hypothetical protein